jgi:16S rRNA (adenine1518-N6/adenine1519-N6)-dimethyltransferase
MSLESLPPLRESLAAHGLLARKSFGQHFLLDLNITRKIARLAGPFEGRAIIEVGPGPGGLTRALVESDAGKVIAVEKDTRFLPLLAELVEAAEGKLAVVEADALKVEEAKLLRDSGQGPLAHVVSNLPYNIGAPLLLKWLTGAWRPVDMSLMFQKEVAERITARPGEDAYGRLSVIAQAVCETRIVMDLPARAFVPPPKVASAVVRLTPRSPAPPADVLSALERVTAGAFGQRRKMLKSSLKALGGEALLTACEIDPAARAEVLTVEQFLRLGQAVGQKDQAFTPAPPSAP